MEPTTPYDQVASIRPDVFTPAEKRAEAAEAEALGNTPRTITFGEGDDAVTLHVPRKWKRFKFMRALTRGDIGAALEAIWPPSPVLDEQGRHQRDVAGNLMYDDHPQLVLLEEADVTEEEFNAVLEKLGAAVSSGVEAGNSTTSPTS